MTHIIVCAHVTSQLQVYSLYLIANLHILILSVYAYSYLKKEFDSRCKSYKCFPNAVCISYVTVQV